MKKIKIMLLSLALFAVVGGALAFKARFGDFFCITPTQAGGSCPQTCPNPVASTTTTANVDFVCTARPYTVDVDDITCTSLVNPADPHSAVTTTICAATTTKLTID